MNKKLVIAVAVVAVVLVAILLFGQRILSPQKNLFFSKVVASNFRYPAQLTPSEAYYFNGSTFLKFDLATQASSPLTPIYSLPNVLEVQWSKNGVLFKANDYSTLDQLKPILDQERLPSNASYWWSVSFSNGQIKLVGSPQGPSSDGAASDGTVINSAVWSIDGETYYYTQIQLFRSQPYEYTVFSGSLGGPNNPLAKIDGPNLLWADQDKLIYKVDTANKHTLSQLNIKDQTVQVLYDNFKGLTVLNTSGVAGLIVPIEIKKGQEALSEVNGPLQLLSLSDTASPTTIDTAFSGTAAWSRSADAWAAVETVGENELTGYLDDGTGKIFELSFKLSKGQAIPSNLKVVAYENDQILLLDSSNNAYVASPEQLDTKEIEPFKPSQWNYSGIEELMKHGLTNTQSSSLKYAIYQYALSSSLNPKVVDITNVDLEPIDRKNPTGKATANFNIAMSQRTFRAKMEYYDLTTIRLYLYDSKSNTLLFDSKPVNNRNVN